MSSAEHTERPPEVVPGQIVGGKWRIVAPLGRGGMGAVYEGQNISIGKRVALKFIDSEFARQPEVASRFQREAEAASLVESAHIVHIFDSGTTETGIPYIVMELLRGEDLRARLRRLGKLPPDEAAHIVAQTLRGLHRAHEAGIVHRDLKPDNVFLVDRDDDPLFAKIVDFGISKMTRRSGMSSGGTLTRQGVVLGTPFYMSPEQAQALPNLDARTDLWSVGAILYECLAGKPPHTGDAYEQIIISICTTDAVPLRALDPNVPEALAAVAHRALTRDPARRFQTATEMLDALLATGVGGRTTAMTPRVGTYGAAANVADSAAKNGNDAIGGRTRVSWTTGDAKPAALAATVLESTDRLARARTVRRRGLVLVGAAVMLAAFVLTAGFLRGRRAERHAANPKPVAVMPAAAPSASTADTSVVDVHPADTPSATAHATPAPGKPRKTFSPSPTTPSPTTPAVPAAAIVPAPSASPSKTGGVAGGLQIKTNYP